MQAGRQRTTNRNQAFLLAVGVSSGVIILGGWALISSLPEAVVRALALIALFSVPAAFWLGYRLGNRDAQSYVKGIERGAGTVINAGGRVADLRASKVTAARRREREPDVKLPRPTRIEIVDAPEQGEMVEI
jgi:heme A synthase